MYTPPMSFTLKTTWSANGLGRKLGWVIAVLSGLHILVMLIHYLVTDIPWLIVELFDLDEEQSFGTWFSVVILLFTGYVLLLYSASQSRQGDSGILAWRILGIGFCFLSIDEMVGLHETVNSVIEMSWAIPGGLIALAIGVIYIPFLMGLPRPTLFRFLIGGMLYVGGAVGVELATEPYAEADLLDTLEYNLTTVLEEAMEMSGVLVFLTGLLRHIATTDSGAVDSDAVVKT